jgi:septal ring-binding cell division protein DamX
MLINVPLRLLALLSLVVASGCSHLPSLGSISFFSGSNPTGVAPTEVPVVESVPMRTTTSPTSHLTQPVTQPRVMLAEVEAAVQNSSLSANYAAKAVALGDAEGVMDLPPSYWAVQIAAVKDIERVAKMVKDNRLEGMLGVPMNTDSGPLHAVLTGVFVKREDAQASAENLPPALAGYEPWVRPLAHLQAAMR